MEPLRVLLAPFALLHACVLHLRHWLFDVGVFSSTKADLPTVVVGNLSAGGSGKTPFTEWLIRQLDSGTKVAVLSRGYGRSTKGFRWVDASDLATQAGDEPLLIKHKFPHIPVAVCEDRLEGVRRIAQENDAQLVILDDAFQHRKLTPDYAILLTPWHKPWFKDHLLPWGGLRDIKPARKRAHSTVVTKCPKALPDLEAWRNKLKLTHNQSLHQAELVYSTPQPHGHSTPFETLKSALVVTGIADNSPLLRHVDSLVSNWQVQSYPDHHRYSLSDLENIREKSGTFEDGPTAVITTEKDWIKLRELPESNRQGLLFFVLPVQFQVSDPHILTNAVLQCINSARS